MPFCPRCRSEYLPQIARCATCEVELVDALPEMVDEGKGERLREAVAKGEGATPVVRAAYAEACQAVELLQAGGVDAMVTPDETPVQPGHPKFFFVSVLVEDVDAAREVMRGEWKKLVESDPDAAGADPDAMVDFDAEGSKNCPACGTAFEGAPEECPECGLFLGVA